MSELLSDDELRIVAKEAKRKYHVVINIYRAIAQAQLEHLKAEGWKSPSEVAAIAANARQNGIEMAHRSLR